MQEHLEIIKGKGIKYSLKIIPENPFIKILDIRYENGSNLDSLALGSLMLLKDWGEGRTHSEALVNSSFPVKFGSSLKEVKKVEVVYAENRELEQPIKIYYINQNIRSLAKPSESFDQRFSSAANRRVFFSGKFGSGKTTFLNIYFQRRKDKYNVFRINPVHYSIASNEDIFKYIKADLLYQLLIRVTPETIEQRKESLIDRLSWEIYSNGFVKTLGRYAELISSLGKSISQSKAKALFATLHILVSLGKKVSENEINGEESENESITKFFNGLEIQEGGLLEYNSITRIIEFYLEIIKEEDKKENVLLIDDLDRLDPDHIFRILNIISAHFDSAVHSDLERDKFGFDKLIVVADRDNIEGIYKHRFGEEVDFEGYIEKLSGSSPHDFSNKEAMLEVIGEITDRIHDNPRTRDLYNDVWNVLNVMLESNVISIRELVKLNNLEIQDSRSVVRSETNSRDLFVTNVLIHYFSRIWKLHTLKRKFVVAKRKRIEAPFDFIQTMRMIPGLGKKISSSNKPNRYEIQVGKYSLDYDLLSVPSIEFYVAEIAEPSSGVVIESASPKLTEDELNWDFYIDIIILQIDRYTRESKFG